MKYTARYTDKFIDKYLVMASISSDFFGTYYRVSVTDVDIIDTVAEVDCQDKETMYQVFDNIGNSNINKFIEDHQFAW